MKWITLEEAGKTCVDHGEYISQHMELEGSEAPEFLREHWTNCPRCNVFYEIDAAQTKEDMTPGKMKLPT